jgi:tetratricopeptide (TPR) repeat protein
MISEAKNTLKPPTLADLMLRFVNRPVDAASIEAEASALGEVEPHEVAVGFRTDPRLAWNEGLAALAAFGLKDAKAAAPTEWAAIVVRHDPAACQPFALAGYPQRVRDLTALLQTRDLTRLRPSGESQEASAHLRSWAIKQVAKKEPALALLAAAVLRAAQDLEQAEATLNGLRGQLPAEFQALFGNEEAALLWQKGAADRAVAIWDKLPDSPTVFFNRGMAALFMGNVARARENLKKAIAQLPESHGWHHLASLYLALAEIGTV